MAATQEQRINKYLQDVEAHLGHFPPQARRDELLRLRPRIEQALAELGAQRPPEKEVELLLRRLDGPKVRMARMAAAIEWPAWTWDPPALAVAKAEWLGVCAGIAERYGWPARYVRLAVVALGLLTGPLALIGYLAAYALMRAYTDREEVQRIDPWRVALSVAATLASALAVYAVAELFVVLILHVHGHAVSPVDSALSSTWSWYLNHETSWLFKALYWTLPLAVLGSMPLAHRWDATLTKLAQAILAVYAVAASLGVAALFAGALLQIIQHTTGIVVVA